MVIQYRKKTGGRWKDYPGKNEIDGDVMDYDFRLLTKDKSRILVDSGSYEEVMKRFRQIEFFKHR